MQSGAVIDADRVSAAEAVRLRCQSSVNRTGQDRTRQWARQLIGRVKCWNLLVLVLAHADADADADCRQMDLGARTYELGYGLKWLACEMRTCFLFFSF